MQKDACTLRKRSGRHTIPAWVLPPSSPSCQVAGLYATYKQNNGTNYTGGRVWFFVGRSAGMGCRLHAHVRPFLIMAIQYQPRLPTPSSKPCADSAPAVASAAGPAADPAMVAASGVGPSSGGGGGLTGGEIAGIVLVSVGAAAAVVTGLIMAAVAYRKRSQG